MNPIFIITILAALCMGALGACSKNDGVHNLSVDEKRRAETFAKAYYDGEHPAATAADGSLTKIKGSFLACRPQDSNSNGLVTCSGMVPNRTGGFVEQTRYCGYIEGGVIGCSDKDQQ